MKGFIVRFIGIIFILFGFFHAPENAFAQTCTCTVGANMQAYVSVPCPSSYISGCTGNPYTGSLGCSCTPEQVGVNCVTSGTPGTGQTCCSGYHIVAGVCISNGSTPSNGTTTGSTTQITTPDICCDAACTRVSTAIGCIPANITDITSTLLSFGVGIAGGIAFLLILLGGFQILTSSGNPEQLEAGKELVSSAITGLILIIFSVFILKFLGVNVLGIPTLQ